MKIINSILFFQVFAFSIFLAPNFFLPLNAQICSRDKPPAFDSKYNTDDAATRKRIEKLFLDARKNSPLSTADVSLLNVKTLPYLAVYLKDDDETTRRTAAKLVGLTKNEAALPLLAAALEDRSADVRNAAAQSLDDNFEQDAIIEKSFVENALCRSVENGSDSAAAILLFSRFVENPQTENVLIFRLKSAANETTNFYPLKKPVKVSFILKMAQSEVGSKVPRRAFRQAIADATLDELAFLLWTMRELGDPDLLHDLRKTLFDNRKISYENAKGITVSRRLRDLAVEKFVQRLKLTAGFKVIAGKVYSSAETKEIDDLIQRSIPQS